MFNKIHEKAYKKSEMVYKFPYIYSRNIQIYKIAYKKVKLFHNMTTNPKNQSKLYTNSLKMTYIHMKKELRHMALLMQR